MTRVVVYNTISWSKDDDISNASGNPKGSCRTSTGARCANADGPGATARLSSPIVARALPPKEAGAMILLYRRESDLFFVLTERNRYRGNAQGTISLPGGAREDGEGLEETARRETSEELGIDPGRIEILGPPLTVLFIPVSGFCVTPFVGYYKDTAEFVPEPDEVIELIHTPVSSLLDESCVEREIWEIRGERVLVPFFRLGGHKVWGATAMMLSEFAVMLRELGQLDGISQAGANRAASVRVVLGHDDIPLDQHGGGILQGT